MSFYVLGVAVLVGIAAMLAVDALLRLLRGPVPANFGAMFARQGVDWSQAAKAGMAGETCVALDRCAECSTKERCDEWLAGGRRDGAHEFCPNARFLERLKNAAQR